MSEPVQPLRIIVASPSDVAKEREIVEHVAAKLNRTTAADRGLRLEVGRWETDAYPGFHVDGPQGVCDHVLNIEDCDVLVGIFWTRFGKPTSTGQTGTEHEIEKAITSWRKTGNPHVMVFFNDQEIYLKSAVERRQWVLVAEYRERFPADGLFWEYHGADAFEEEFRKCAENYLRDKFSLRKKVGRNARKKHITADDAAIISQNGIRILIDSRVPPDKAASFFSALSDLLRNGFGGVGIQVDMLHRPKDKGEPDV